MEEALVKLGCRTQKEMVAREHREVEQPTPEEPRVPSVHAGPDMNRIIIPVKQMSVQLMWS
jgi:hypothetical protein